jgi:small-conductance mechanosensitive channel
MKLFIFLLAVVCSISASEVDTKLYGDLQQRISYYEEIQKQIEATEHTKLQSAEILKEEKLYLSRLRSASSQDVQIEQYDLKTLTEETVSFDNYYNAVNAVASLLVKQNQHSKMLRALNDKSLFSKKEVENIVEEDKPKLLSFQLQHAYYKLQEKNIETKLQLIQTHEKEIMQTLFNSITLLTCDTVKKIDEKLQLSYKDIEKISLKKVALQIDLEKALIEDSIKIDQIKQKIESAEALYQQAINDKVMYSVQQSLCMLNRKQNKRFFKKIDEIEVIIKDTSGDSKLIYREQLNVLREISKDVFGSTKLFFGATLHEINEMLMQVKGYFTSTIFVFNERSISLLSLIKAILLIIVGFFIGGLYKRWITRISRKWPDMSQMSVRVTSNIGYYLIVITLLIIAIGSIGIDLTSVSLIAGALSIGIGFGLQTVVSNFIAGIILMFERTIRIGDTVEISDTLRGRVTDMRIRSTTIKTFDNIDIVVPNSSFIQNNVVNWTLEDVSRRLHIPFSVAYGTEVKDVMNVILDELKQSELKYIDNDTTKEAEVWMTDMNKGSVDYELLVWVEWDSRLRPNSLKSDFLILIYNALNKHGIEIPFPQLDLHVKHMPTSV